MVSDVFQPKGQMQLVLIGFLGSHQKEFSERTLTSLNIAHSLTFVGDCWKFLKALLTETYS